MLISLKHRYAFFCTPKCASNSIEAMLKPHADIHLLGSPQVRHTNARQYEKHIQPYLADVSAEQTTESTKPIERVAIVREPVAWLHSWYRFRARSALRNADSQNSTAHVSFSEFVDAYLSEQQPPFAQVGTQLEFLTDTEGKLGVDRLYAYDNLNDLAAYFSTLVGQQLSLTSINVSPTKVYKSNILEALGALRRRIWSRSKGSGRRGQPVTADARAELTELQIERLGAYFSEEMELHANALRGPLLKTEWDGRHSGETG
jgi:hypothetical protein